MNTVRPGCLEGWTFALVFLAALAAMGTGCSSDDLPAPRVIVLVSLDTLRADHLGLYGYKRPTSPILDRLAGEAVVFEDVTTPSPWTLPAHGSLLTGLYPSRHGLKSHERYLPSRIPTVASILSKQGWATAAAVNSHNLSPLFGLDRGFEQYLYVEETADQTEPTTRVTDKAIEWLREPRSRPLFLLVHYYDVHTDYRSLPRYQSDFVRPYGGVADGTTAQLIAFREGEVALGEKDAAHLVDLYDAGVRQMDDELGRLVSVLREGALRGESLLIVTSDHGEEFLEHGDLLHGRSQFQEVVRVPLFFVGPAAPGPHRISTPVSLVDVAPTILGLAGVDTPESLDGIDISPLWKGKDAQGRYIFGEADHNNVEHDITRMVRNGRLKLHYNRLSREHQVYDLLHDPEERRDVASENEAATKELLAALESFMKGAAEEAPTRQLSPEEIEKLRSLGYVR